MALPAYDLYFTGSRDPCQCIIIGEGVEPLFFRFETLESFTATTRTMVHRNQDGVVATLDWNTSPYLGTCTVKHRQQPFPMSTFVLPSANPDARAFFLDGTKFEWRRTREDQGSYDLFHVPQGAQSVRIAFFRKYDQATPVGPSHGFLQYTFTQSTLLLEAILALCLNRWLDLNVT
ncbi:hypothetical protein M0805_003018 [Coniferiporia weirii]|nr:hypothetical protein M0805_003018 [Coniferiporia weirii]